MTCRWLIASIALTACFAKPSRPDGVTPEDGAPIDGNDRDVPRVIGVVGAASMTSSTLRYSLTVGDAADRFLLVAVLVSTSCAGPTPNVASVLFGGQPLQRIDALVGTPCGSANTRTEHWGVVAPAMQTADVMVTLDGVAPGLHSIAIATAGIDQQLAVAKTASQSGTGTGSEVTIATDATDLIIDSIGQGNKILAPGPQQTQELVHNVNTDQTQNNSAASVARGGTTTTLTWTFGAADEWQAMATALRAH